MKIAIGSDHRGFHLKARVKEMLASNGYDVVDLGVESPDSADYPDFAFPAAEMVASGEAERGILICGSGIGMSIAANKVRGIRAAFCRTVDEARMTRLHNDSNVLTLSETSMDDPSVEELVRVWLETPFEGGRHQRRVDKISSYEDRTR